MEKKIKDLEALLKKAMELASEISDEAAEAEYNAHDEYRSLRHSEDEKAEDRAYERYRMFSGIKSDAEFLELHLKNIRLTNSLFTTVYSSNKL